MGARESPVATASALVLGKGRKEPRKLTQLFVAAGIAECFAVEDIRARENLHSPDSRLHRAGETGNQDDEAATAHVGEDTRARSAQQNAALANHR